jgi:hypothetical protein
MFHWRRVRKSPGALLEQGARDGMHRKLTMADSYGAGKIAGDRSSGV